MKIGDGLAAVVSGGASGLGEATVRALADKGAAVTILDLDGMRGASMASQVGGLFVKTDVTDADAVARALTAGEKAHGPARVCVSCAGIAPGAKTVDREGQPHDPAIFEKTIAINVMGTFNLSTKTAARMTALDPVTDDGERGVIINTASIAAYEGQIGQIAYSASKGAVAAMTLPMARDLHKQGVRVNAIAPGLFKTPMVAGLPDEVQGSLASSIPFPSRFGDPSEFAALALHMVENAMMNGSVIRLDGAIRLAPR